MQKQLERTWETSDDDESIEEGENAVRQLVPPFVLGVLTMRFFGFCCGNVSLVE